MGLSPGLRNPTEITFRPKRLDRLNAVLPNHARLVADPQHERDVGTVHVRIEQADFVSHLDQSDGQVHRQRGLADAALSRPDGDNGVHARQRLRALLRRTLSMLMRHMCVQRDHTPDRNCEDDDEAEPQGLIIQVPASAARVGESGHGFDVTRNKPCNPLISLLQN